MYEIIHPIEAKRLSDQAWGEGSAILKGAVVAAHDVDGISIGGPIGHEAGGRLLVTAGNPQIRNVHETPLDLTSG